MSIFLSNMFADRIEYSQPTIYEYFENKEAILLALLSQGFEQVLTEMRQARTQQEQPETHLLAMVGAYWTFAFRCPELYQVMYGFGGVSITHAQTPSEARAIFALLRDTLNAWMERYQIERADVDACVDVIWASVISPRPIERPLFSQAGRSSNKKGMSSSFFLGKCFTTDIML